MTGKRKTSIIVDPDKCTGCRLCEMACSMAHQGILSPVWSRIRVLRFEDGGENVPLVCQACEDAPCIKTCPMNARRRLDNHAVVTDEDRCIGCRACAYICPIGAPAVDPASGKAMTCDLCVEEGSRPWCVTACRDYGALKAVDSEKTALRKSRDRAAQVKGAYKPKKKG